MYEKTVSKGHLEYSYLKVKLVYESDGDSPDIDANMFKHIITTALNNLFGEVGTSLSFDVLGYVQSTRQAFLRVKSRYLHQLWTSLSMFGVSGGSRCAFYIEQVSGHLLGLAANSRDFVPNTVDYENS